MSRILISIILFLCCYGSAVGSAMTGFRHITVNNGLPRNGVLAILPSTRGPVYVGTWDGLFALNGLTVKEIMFTPSSNTPVHTVNALTEDASGNIWVATSEGLMMFNPITNTCDHIPGSDTYVSSLYCDEANRIHFVENLQTYKILNQTTDSITSSPANGRIAGYDKLPAETVAAFTDSRGHVFAATNDGGLFEASDRNSAFHKIHHSQSAQKTITEHNAQILFGSNDGLTVYDTSTGLIDRVEIDYSNPDGINDRRITTMAVDYENGLWIGTFYGGINYLSPTAKNFAGTEVLNANLSGHVISGITRDSNGLLWIGIEDSGIASYDPATGKIENFAYNSSAPDAYRPATANVQTIFADETTIYVGTAGFGMDIIETPSMHHKRFNGTTVGDTRLPTSIYSFIRAKNGLIYIGTMSGLFTFNPATERFSTVNNIPKAIFHCLAIDDSGTIWAASQGAGLYSITPHGETRHYRLPSDMIMSACPVGDTVWVGTEGDGLFIINKSTGSVEPLPITLPERLMVFTIIADGDAVWFSTNKGLMYYDPTNMRLEHYTEADGLGSNQFKINSGLRLPDGHILMGSVSGIYAFKTSEIIRNDAKPTAYLTEAVHPYSSIEPDSSILVANRITIPHGGNSIEFHFASSSHANPEKNRFEFMLEPCQQNWQITDSHAPTASYTNLNAGNYTFRLRTSNGNGLYSEERKITLTVSPQTGTSKAHIWLIAGLSIVLITSIIIFLHLRRKKLPAPSIPDNLNITDRNAPADVASPDAEFLQKLNEVIDKHMDNSSLTVDELASLMAMGRSSFFNKVKELTNQTPNNYLRTMRLKRASTLLESGALRINEVAYRVGFASPSYFVRRFSEMYGVSPAEYQAAGNKKSKIKVKSLGSDCNFS